MTCTCHPVVEQEVPSSSSYTSNEGSAASWCRQWQEKEGTETAKTTMKQPASSEVLRYLAAFLCLSSEMFNLCDAKIFSSSDLYDYTSLSGLVSKSCLSNYRIHFKISLSPQKSNNISFPPRSQQDSRQIHTHRQKLQKAQKYMDNKK